MPSSCFTFFTTLYPFHHPESLKHFNHDRHLEVLSEIVGVAGREISRHTWFQPDSGTDFQAKYFDKHIRQLDFHWMTLSLFAHDLELHSSSSKSSDPSLAQAAQEVTAMQARAKQMLADARKCREMCRPTTTKDAKKPPSHKKAVVLRTKRTSQDPPDVPSAFAKRRRVVGLGPATEERDESSNESLELAGDISLPKGDGPGDDIDAEVEARLQASAARRRKDAGEEARQAKRKRISTGSGSDLSLKQDGSGEVRLKKAMRGVLAVGKGKRLKSVLGLGNENMKVGGASGAGGEEGEDRGIVKKKGRRSSGGSREAAFSEDAGGESASSRPGKRTKLS